MLVADGWVTYPRHRRQRGHSRGLRHSVERTPISPLHQRMLDDMTFRNMSPNTLKVYSASILICKTRGKTARWGGERPFAA
jgi:hypothetical protein